VGIQIFSQTLFNESCSDFGGGVDEGLECFVAINAQDILRNEA